jgi:hypothetical protein
MSLGGLTFPGQWLGSWEEFCQERVFSPSRNKKRAHIPLNQRCVKGRRGGHGPLGCWPSATWAHDRPWQLLAPTPARHLQGTVVPGGGGWPFTSLAPLPRDCTSPGQPAA